MTKGKIIAALVLIVGIVWLVVEPPAALGGTEESAAGDRSVVSESRPVMTSFVVGEREFTHPSTLDESNEDHRFTRFEDGVVYLHHPVSLSGALHKEGGSARRDLEILDEIMANYRLVFKENPVGTENEEFAQALAGENSKKVVFIDPGLLSGGELLDRFGAPYVFHPLKVDVMSLRSRGKDGQLWTDDDVLLGHPKVESSLGLLREE